MEKYRKNPVGVEATQYTQQNVAALLQQLHADPSINPLTQIYYSNNKLYINTLEGTMSVAEGGFIIKGTHGELYACQPDIFAKCYTKIPDHSKFGIDWKWLGIGYAATGGTFGIIALAQNNPNLLWAGLGVHTLMVIAVGLSFILKR